MSNPDGYEFRRLPAPAHQPFDSLRWSHPTETLNAAGDRNQSSMGPGPWSCVAMGRGLMLQGCVQGPRSLASQDAQRRQNAEESGRDNLSDRHGAFRARDGRDVDRSVTHRHRAGNYTGLSECVPQPGQRSRATTSSVATVVNTEIVLVDVTGISDPVPRRVRNNVRHSRATFR